MLSIVGNANGYLKQNLFRYAERGNFSYQVVLLKVFPRNELKLTKYSRSNGPGYSDVFIRDLLNVYAWNRARKITTFRTPLKANE